MYFTFNVCGVVPLSQPSSGDLVYQEKNGLNIVVGNNTRLVLFMFLGDLCSWVGES